MTQHGKNRAHEERMASYEKTMAVHIKAATSASEVVECLTKTVMKEFSHRHFDTYEGEGAEHGKEDWCVHHEAGAEDGYRVHVGHESVEGHVAPTV